MARSSPRRRSSSSPDEHRDSREGGRRNRGVLASNDGRPSRLAEDDDHQRELVCVDLLRRATALPVEDQLWLIDAVQEHLAADPHRSRPGRKQVRLRRKALAAIRAVAEHLDLPDGVGPTAAQYRAARRSSGLSGT